MPISATGTHLTHDGAPFFWLADTAWNGVLKATDQEWEQYLATRAAQGFNVIQFVCTHWRAYDEEPAFILDPLRMNDDFFARRDRRVQMIREHGLIPAPVLLWALTDKDPGVYLSEDDAVTVARYLIDRWGGDPVVWILGGDGHYDEEKADRWHRIGREVFAPFPPHSAGVSPAPVTMHPCGQSWVTSEFRHEPWLSFHGYQSGHGDADAHLRWLLNGPPERPWEGEPVQPIINLEPNYEGHPAYQSRQSFTDYHVRRASYWSLTVTPTAGVTYGNNSIWWWGREPEVPLDHGGIGVVEPWRAGLNLPGVAQMTILRTFFESLPWWELRPAQHLLTTQPGENDPNLYQTVAATDDGAVIVAYLPLGGTISLKSKGMAQAKWFDPRKGTYTEGAVAEVFDAPDAQDWVLLLRSS